MSTWQGTLDSVAIGASASETTVVSGEMIDAFVAIAGSRHPLHTSDEWARANTHYPGRVAHGVLIHALMSRPLARIVQDLGVKTALVSTAGKYIRPVCAGDTVTVTLTVSEKLPERQRFRVSAEARNQHGALVMVGEALEQVLG
ncbi:MAG: MaoC family dehydratase N-terminal domain-containing protein [Chloroflexi bacterium]|nr:MaoC family dehydratase N-terminal domain-containing protein [Chloroflexota bacterium]MBI4504231.1 MaoC family dehydratase N-terminal domain-containing protein [Chloroflexota bacterium]